MRCPAAISIWSIDLRNSADGAPPGALGSVDLAAQRKRTLDLFTTGSNDLGMGAKRLMPGLVLQFSGTYLQSGGWPLG